MGLMEPDLRSVADRHDQRLLRRLDVLVPELMERAGIDAWVIAAREYNEDPVLATMVPATWLGTVRRRTILVFLRRGEEVERLAISRYAVGRAFPAAWEPEKEPVAAAGHRPRRGRPGADRDQHLAGVRPGRDGLTVSEREALVSALPQSLRDRIVPATETAIGWLETRIPDEIEIMAEACSIAHGFLAGRCPPR